MTTPPSAGPSRVSAVRLVLTAARPAEGRWAKTPALHIPCTAITPLYVTPKVSAASTTSTVVAGAPPTDTQASRARAAATPTTVA